MTLFLTPSLKVRNIKGNKFSLPIIAFGIVDEGAPDPVGDDCGEEGGAGGAPPDQLHLVPQAARHVNRYLEIIILYNNLYM